MKRTVPELEAMFAAGEPEDRRRAVKELVGLRGEGVVPLFVRALGDVDWRVRKEAASLTPRVEPRDELLEALARSLDARDDIGLRNAAVEAMVSLGPDAVPLALVALDTLDADARKLAIEVLAGVPDARGVTRLVGALQDVDANVVVAAAEALGKAGLASEASRDEATHALAGCLDSGSVGLALAALDSLVELDARLPYARIRPLAQHPLLKRAAISAAARSREDAALTVLVDALGTTPASREATLALAVWLRDVGPQGDLVERLGALLCASPALLAAVRFNAAEAPDPELRAASMLLLSTARQTDDLALLVSALEDEVLAGAAQQSLTVFGPAASSGLASLLDVAAPRARATLLELLASLGGTLEPRSLRVVRECLNDPSPDVVTAGASALGVFGDERDLGRLVSLTVHGDPRVAEAATSSVTALAARHRAAARALLGALDPTAEHAAAGAAIVSALARSDSGRAGVMTELLSFGERALRSVDARARRIAVDALAASGDEAAIEKIAVALSDEEREVRLAAVRALGTLRATEALRALLRDSTDEETLSVALRALAEASPAGAVDVARNLLRNPDPALASTAVEVFARATEPARTDSLLSALHHADKDVVMLALSELGGALSPQALPRAAVCLTHPAWEVRRLASEIFGEHRSEAARELLRARLELEREPEVREALTEALSIRPPRDGGGG